MILTKIRTKIRNQRGIGLMEMMLSLTIILFIVAMGYRYYTSAKMAKNTAASMEMINQVIAAGIKYKINRGSYDGIHQAELYNRGYLKDGIFGSGSLWNIGTGVGIRDINESDDKMEIIIDTVNVAICTRVSDLLSNNVSVSNVTSNCTDNEVTIMIE